MRESGEALVKSFGIRKGLKVLDLGCGDGTTALPAARLGADVLGVDIARNLVPKQARLEPKCRGRVCETISRHHGCKVLNHGCIEAFFGNTGPSGCVRLVPSSRLSVSILLSPQAVRLRPTSVA